MSRQSPATAASAEGIRITLWGVGVNFLLTGLKFVAGVWGNSSALIADGVHSLSDLFSDVVVLAGLKAGRKPADQDHHFGHGRLETLASGIVGVLLVVAALALGLKAGQEMGLLSGGVTRGQPHYLAVAAALASLLAKEWLYRATVEVGRSIRSNALIANAWHHRSDSLSSLAVLLGVAGAAISPALISLDAVAALVVTIFVAKAGLAIIHETLNEFTDHAPDTVLQKRFLDYATRVPGVKEVHDMRVRSVGGRYQMELHVVVDGDLPVRRGHRIAKEVEARLHEEFAEVDQVIIHVDPLDRV